MHGFRTRRGSNRRCPRVLWSGRIGKKEKTVKKEISFHARFEDKTVESSPFPHDVVLSFTTKRNRMTLSIFPWFNYATKPENRNKTLSFKWIPAGSGLENISEYVLSLSSVGRWPVNWKNYSCYMYGFGDRIVRGGMLQFCSTSLKLRLWLRGK